MFASVTLHPLWLQNYISRLGVFDTVNEPLKICYNSSTIVSFSTSDKYSKGTNTQELKYFAIKRGFKNKESALSILKLNSWQLILWRRTTSKLLKERVHRTSVVYTFEWNSELNYMSLLYTSRYFIFHVML